MCLLIHFQNEDFATGWNCWNLYAIIFSVNLCYLLVKTKKKRRNHPKLRSLPCHASNTLVKSLKVNAMFEIKTFLKFWINPIATMSCSSFTVFFYIPIWQVRRNFGLSDFCSLVLAPRVSSDLDRLSYDHDRWLTIKSGYETMTRRSKYTGLCMPLFRVKLPNLTACTSNKLMIKSSNFLSAAMLSG